MQYVNFGGLDKAATILNEHPFQGPIVRILPQIDLFIETTVSRKRPVFVTALREETRTDYPQGAIRELVMNAIMHRDYQGNAPIHFYQYAERLEVVNHGGLYGRARPENFPNVSDYRNPIIAEAMKVLGYVNCYNRGINMIQDELVANGNGKAEFSFHLITAFEAKVALAAKEALRDAVSDEQGSSIKSIQKSMQKSMQNLGRTDSEIVRKIKDAPNITTLQLAEQIGMSRIGIQKAIARLKAKGIIRRVGPDKGGHWEVVG